MASDLLKEARIKAKICANLDDFKQSLNDDTLFGVLTEESVHVADLHAISKWIDNQPQWSDLPFIIITQRGGGLERNPVAGRLLDVFGNVTFLERPFHPTTFVSLARSAVKGRKKQFDARAGVELLEAHVAERTAELEQAHAEVIDEIAQRERAEALLRQSQKMEAIGKLTGGVAHDFNNLLMAVIGNLDLLRKRVGEDTKTLRLIDGAIQGAQRGAVLTQRLLAFARKQELVIEPKNIAELVAGMTDLLERSLGSEIELKLQLQANLPPASVDSNQIELALLNLVVNARDAMPGGGLVTISTSMETEEIPQELSSGTFVKLAVQDTGHGMDAEVLSKAMEPFYSTKEVGKGTGLGLSMIQGLALQLNGALVLRSEPDRGTVAELWLPVAPQSATVIHKEISELEPFSPMKELTILVVDDDPLISMSTVDMLEDLGHNVLEANSGAAALDIIRHNNSIDLIVTDYSMPQMNGAQFAEAARNLLPNVPILLATGFAELPDGNSINLPRLGKPYQQQQLAFEISKLFNPA